VAIFDLCCSPLGSRARHLHVYVCMYTPVCTHVCIHLYIYTSMYTSVCIHPYVYICMNTSVCIHLYVCTCMHTSVCIHLYVNSCMYTSVCIHQYIKTSHCPPGRRTKKIRFQHAVKNNLKTAISVYDFVTFWPQATWRLDQQHQISKRCQKQSQNSYFNL